MSAERKPVPQRLALVLGATDDADLPVAREALGAAGMEVFTESQLGLALARLAGMDAALAVILAPPGGIDVALVGQALRGLPGHADLPLILVGAQAPAGWRRCSVLSRPFEIRTMADLAGCDPEAWPGPCIHDPQPLAELERLSPGITTSLLQVFARDLHLAMARAQELQREGDVQQLGRLAHKLKGSSGSVGARELYAAAAGLVQAVREGDQDPIPLVDRLLAAGTRWLERDCASDSSPASVSRR